MTEFFVPTIGPTADLADTPLTPPLSPQAECVWRPNPKDSKVRGALPGPLRRQLN